MARLGLVLGVLLIAGLAVLCSFPVPAIQGQGGQLSPRISDDDLSFVYLPLVNRDDRRGECRIVLDEDFEGTFGEADEDPEETPPKPHWKVVDQNAPKNGVYYWAKSACQAASGSHSGWAIGGGLVGGELVCGAQYPFGVYSWMTYGPVDLSDATSAELRFKRWVNTVGEGDSLQYLASTDNSRYEGFKLFNRAPEWKETVFDLTQVPVLGDLTDQPQVWIRFVFETKDPNSLREGAYVDDVILRKWVLDAD